MQAFKFELQIGDQYFNQLFLSKMTSCITGFCIFGNFTIRLKKKNMNGSGNPNYPNFLPPYPTLFFPFWSNYSSEKENGRLPMHSKGFLSLVLREKQMCLQKA